ncbi:Satratoxin biosynthesis SC14 cluster protein [Paramyrothecium foliicola]|nr:Satratoxin biosynthesis SC14 cluster protein [Paramyrothecium foliicola]
MMKLLHTIFSACVLAAGAHALDLISAAGKLPPCGLTCLTSSIAASSCSSILDAECICSDTKFQDAATQCVVGSCSIIEALDIGRIQAEACQWPVRNRQIDLLLPLIVQVPAALCPWLRLYARWSTSGRLALDDYLVAIAGIAFVALIFIAQINGHMAFGVDVWTVDIPVMTTGLKWFFIGESLYLFVLGLTKVSVMCFYLRIFPQRAFRYTTYACISFVVASTTAFILVQIFQCRPIEFTWEGWTSDERPEKCLDVNILAYAAAGSSIFQDVMVLILPLPLVYKLQTGRRAKFGITLMFSLGIFVLVTSCVRLRYIVGFGHTHNPSWDYTDPAIWSGLEVAVSVIVVCLPAIRLLVDRLKPGWLVTAFSRSRTTSGKDTAMAGTKSSTLRKDRSAMRSESRNAIYRSGGGTNNDSDIELGPHLGDKLHGDVQTQIYPDGAGPVEQNADGIQVTTITRIENGWRESNRKSNLSTCSSELGPRVTGS